MKRLIFLLLLFIPFFACAQNGTGKLPYKNLVQSYRGDTVKTTIETTVEINTNLPYFDFNKPVRVNGTIVGYTATIGDTVIFSNGSMMWSPNGHDIYFKPALAETSTIIHHNADGTVSLMLDELWFGTEKDTTSGYAGKVRFKSSDGHYYGYGNGKWQQLDGGGIGTGSGIVETDAYQIAVGNGTNSVGGSTDMIKSGNTNMLMQLHNTSNSNTYTGVNSGNSDGDNKFTQIFAYQLTDYNSATIDVSAGYNSSTKSRARAAGDTVEITGNDAIRINGKVFTRDGWRNATRYSFFYRDSVTGQMVLDSFILNASYGTKSHKSAIELLNEIENGELLWQYEEGKYTHRLDTILISKVINAHTAKIEELVVALADAEKKINELQQHSGKPSGNLLAILVFCVVILLTIKLTEIFTKQ
jgi:hypothetical protein